MMAVAEFLVISLASLAMALLLCDVLVRRTTAVLTRFGLPS